MSIAKKRGVVAGRAKKRPKPSPVFNRPGKPSSLPPGLAKARPGKSGSAPGHNKPPGSKRAIGRGKPVLAPPRPTRTPRYSPPESGGLSAGSRTRPKLTTAPTKSAIGAPKPPDAGMGIVGGKRSYTPRPPDRDMGIIGGGRPNRSRGSSSAIAGPSGVPNTTIGRTLPTGALPNPRPGKSGSAPGHNKPAGQTNAIGRGQSKQPRKPGRGY